ncbi:TolC family protein [Parabacteroides sp. PF5-9]|uniref:TolC family protein n=1 Tax=Parabacteroides sp. PF5-9 TaxID=1742404 RepID=UPI002476A2FF|nr:TolC family protein [Parabacteroides sp. PF5-9]
MEKLRIILLINIFLVGSVTGQENITLFQCYEWAKHNYPQIRQFGLIDQTEQYNLSNAGKGWLPQLTVSGKASYQNEVTKLPFDTEKLTAVLPGFDIPTLSKDQYQVTAELNQTIWDGGIIRSTRELSRVEATVNREQLESDLYALNDRVNQLYFGCLLQDELIRQNELLQHELQVNIDRIVAMMSNGVANQSDKESLEVELLNARQKEIELRASRSAYKQMLSVLTGKELAENVVLERPQLPTTTLSTAINRPELRILEARGKLIETQNKQITAGIMPRINAFVQGGYGRPGLNMLEDSFEPFYIAGVRFSWNLGKLYSLKNDRRKVDVNMRNIDIQRETFLFNTNLQLMQQSTEIRKLRELMRADEEIIRLRSNIKKAAEVKLENGVISVTDLIREINAEDMAKQHGTTRYIQQLMAVYTYLHSTNNKIE